MKLAPLSIGIMQGRLVPPIGDRVQAFPAESWESEFPLAAEIGFDSMELTIEMDSWHSHPIRSKGGRKQIQNLSRSHAIAIAGLCCDTVMEQPITDPDQNRKHGAGDAGLPMIELPVMGNASLTSPAAQDRFVTAMEDILPHADSLHVDVLIESDLPPGELAAVVRRIGHPRFGINYDTGNSTWFGFDPDDELPLLLPFIRNIHIKDCTQADYSVPLGKGETDFLRIFDHLRDAHYDHGFVLQTARQADDVAAATAYHAFTCNLVRGI